MAIEIAYSSFCDMEKRRAYENMQLPALEIDLRAFTPSAFDVTQVKRVALEDTACKYWLWPDRLEGAAMVEQLVELHEVWNSHPFGVNHLRMDQSLRSEPPFH
ncbi:hypothetical protein [Variovorax sp. GB1P17]|uniref:hypothetical protein n=1 Tax=Variovorax sp. GB1P17 TaxID=3443740 RepID=UPI003F46D412